MVTKSSRPSITRFHVSKNAEENVVFATSFFRVFFRLFLSKKEERRSESQHVAFPGKRRIGCFLANWGINPQRQLQNHDLRYMPDVGR